MTGWFLGAFLALTVCLSAPASPLVADTLPVSPETEQVGLKDTDLLVLLWLLPRGVPTSNPQPSLQLSHHRAPHSCFPPTFGGTASSHPTLSHTAGTNHIQHPPCSAMGLCPCSVRCPYRTCMATARRLLFMFVNRFHLWWKVPLLSRFYDGNMQVPPSSCSLDSPRNLELDGLLMINYLTSVSDCHLCED